MKNKPKRNHHILPELYLKGFVIKVGEPFIWVYKRGESYNPGNGKITNNPYKDSISHAGAEMDFYADFKEDGSRDFETFENVLESLEKPANPIFQKLRAYQTISSEEKEVFSRYIILMNRRVEAGRKMIQEFLSKHTYEPSKELFQNAGWPDTPENRDFVKQTVQRLAKKEGYHIQAHNRITALASDSALVEELRKMNWIFFVAPKDQFFLTGDNPVFIPDEFGLGNKKFSELSFPISTNVVLVASWNKSLKDGFVEAKSQVVKELNRRTVSKASQHAYFSRNSEWVVTLLKKKSYKYLMIYSPNSI